MAEERENIGDCPYCRKPVFASEGQAIKWVVLKHPHTKEVLGERPTHRECRDKKKKVMFGSVKLQ